MKTSGTTEFEPHFWRECRATIADFDCLGLIAPARYIRWMEETEYGFLRRVGLSVSLQDDRGQLGFPRLSAQLSIHAAVESMERFRIGMRLANIDGKSIHYDFVLTNQSAPQSRWFLPSHDLIATGSFHVACARFPRDGKPFAILIPDWITIKLRQGIVS